MKIYYRVNENSIEIVRCFGNDSKVLLPDYILGMPVTRVAPYTFSDRKSEPDGVYQVYEAEENVMFSGCEHLLAGMDVEEISFPDTVEEIGNYIFYGCKNLKKLGFSDALVQIGSGAFTGCSGLKCLKVRMNYGNKSCVKEILGELWQRIDVTFCYGNGEKSFLVFPEHYEEAVENTPARLLYTQHHGSGNNYRQCFYDKEMDYRKYDSLFLVAAARDKVEVLADMALGRLEYPYNLAPNHKMLYENLIKERYKEIIQYLIKEEDFSGIAFISSHSLWSSEMLEYALELASSQGKMEILSHLMNQKQKSFRQVRKTFEL